MNKLIMGFDNKKNLKPKNRFEVFKLMFYESPLKLVLLSFSIFISTLPLVILLVSKDIYIMYGDASIKDNPYGLFLINFFTYTISIPLIIIVFVNLGGVFYVIKKMAWDETLDFKFDYKDGIKKSLKESVLLGLILGLSIDVMMTNLYFLRLDLGFDPIITTIMTYLSIIQFIVILLMVMFGMSQAVIYQQSFRSLIKNSFVFAIVKIIKNLLMLTLSMFPLILILLSGNNLLTFIFYLGCGLIGFIFTVIVWTLYSHSIFDRFINQKYFKELVNKGIDTKNNI
ncbi:TPA: hypothetical protein GXZ54_06295 [bacterium]|nr:hypothetical protein [bacterium]